VDRERRQRRKHLSEPVSGASTLNARLRSFADSRSVQRFAIPTFLLAAFAVLLRLTTVTGQWFFADEWEFITTRSRPNSISGLADVYLRPHNEHWSTIPLLVYRAIFGVVGLRSYWPYLVVLLIAHLALAWLISRHLRADGVGLGATLLIVAIFSFLGAGAENILWAFQFAWMGAVGAAFVGMHLLRTDHAQHGDLSQVGLIKIWGVLVAGLMCAGTGIASVVAVGAAVTIRYGWRKAARVVSVPLVVQVIWQATYGKKQKGGNGIDLDSTPYRVVGYAWRAFTSLAERTTGFLGIGAFFIVGMVWLLATQKPGFVQGHPETLGLAIGGVGFSILVALGRVPYDDPDASRYAYVLFALLCPIVALLGKSLISNRPQGWKWSVGLLGVVSLVNSYGTLLDAARSEGLGERRIKNEVRAAFAIGQSPYAADDAVPEPRSPDLTMRRVRALLAQGIVIPGNSSPQTLALVTGRTSVDVTPQPRVPLNEKSLQLAALGRMDAVAAESGCVGITTIGENPQFSLLARRPATFKIVLGNPGMLLITVRRDGFNPPPNQIPAVAGNPMFVNLADPRNEYVIGIPSGGITKVCGVGLDGVR
jgi:hypothetical protein